jgi:hypothetical protein
VGRLQGRAKTERIQREGEALLYSNEWLKLDFSRREEKKTGKKGEAHSFIQGELYKKTKKKVK